MLAEVEGLFFEVEVLGFGARKGLGRGGAGGGCRGRGFRIEGFRIEGLGWDFESDAEVGDLGLRVLGWDLESDAED